MVSPFPQCPFHPAIPVPCTSIYLLHLWQTHARIVHVTAVSVRAVISANDCMSDIDGVSLGKECNPINCSRSSKYMADLALRPRDSLSPLWVISHKGVKKGYARRKPMSWQGKVSHLISTLANNLSSLCLHKTSNICVQNDWKTFPEITSPLYMHPPKWQWILVFRYQNW